MVVFNLAIFATFYNDSYSVQVPKTPQKEDTRINLILRYFSYMSRDVRKPVFGISDLVRHNRAVQSQNMARGLNFFI